MQNYITYLMIPFKQLRITETELAYLGLLLLWDIKGRKHRVYQGYNQEILDTRVIGFNNKSKF